jgi:nucleoside 2-deoxyribosyltransferase
MKVYIAAPWVRRTEAIEVGKQFTAAGHEVTSRWFFHEVVGDPQDSSGLSSPRQDSIRAQAQEDINDVRRADALVVLNLQKSEGKAVETGIAISAGIPVISIGTRSNIFQSLGYEVPTVDDALTLLSCLETQRQRLRGLAIRLGSPAPVSLTPAP